MNGMNAMEGMNSVSYEYHKQKQQLSKTLMLIPTCLFTASMDVPVQYMYAYCVFNDDHDDYICIY